MKNCRFSLFIFLVIMERKVSGSKSVLKLVLRRFSIGEFIMRVSLVVVVYVVLFRIVQRSFFDVLSVSSNVRLMVKVFGGFAVVKERQNVLVMYVFQFGKYKGQIFKWLLENDFGWVIGVVVVFECKDKEIFNNFYLVNKFRLVEYVRMFLEVIYYMLEKKKIVVEKERQKAEAFKVSISFQIVFRSFFSVEDVLKDEDLVEVVNNIEIMEVILGGM